MLVDVFAWFNHTLVGFGMVPYNGPEMANIIRFTEEPR